MSLREVGWLAAGRSVCMAAAFISGFVQITWSIPGVPLP